MSVQGDRKTKGSERLFKEAQRYIPGGVNSPVRAFRAVGGSPLFIQRAQGSRIWDVDGNEYIDYVASWGPLIAGHAHPRVVKALQRAVERGTSYGAPTALEVELAVLIVEAVPSVELVRMVNSGTEAVMSAIRLARGYTKRDKIIKFEGCYHGHSDGLLVRAGSGATTFGQPDSPGVPEDYARNTLLAPFNDLDAVKGLVEANPGQIACVVLEPIAGNMGVIPPQEGFLGGVRKLCDQEGIVLTFDEVITGFRVGWSGAQGIYGVIPDLTCLGKIIGGGLPVGAFGGKREIMEELAPAGKVYQAGTLSGNPLAMTAGIETLKLLKEKGVYERLEKKAAYLCTEAEKIARSSKTPTYFTRVGSMFCTFFTSGPVIDYASAKKSNTEAFRHYFRSLLEQGIYVAPSQFEAGFLSLAHTDADIEKTLAALHGAFRAVS
ncbi:MAG: glutamate-1-semialdehyde-2,1-aminomutase [Deltaproteobacteria bacterium RBG_13_52_11]|nr:MAG: glutamate-1-semialdehyde-2,1-aminomutase [Deltaproteobacteria bacterium RBG_13_52_11]